MAIKQIESKMKLFISCLVAVIICQSGCTNNTHLRINNSIDIDKSKISFKIIGSLFTGVFNDIPIVIDAKNNVCLIDDYELRSNNRLSLKKLFFVEGEIADIYSASTMFSQNKDSNINFIIWIMTLNNNQYFLSKYWLGFGNGGIKRCITEHLYTTKTQASKISLYIEFKNNSSNTDSTLYCQNNDYTKLYQYDSFLNLKHTYVYKPSRVSCFGKNGKPVFILCDSQSMSFMKPLSNSSSKLEIERVIKLQNKSNNDHLIINNNKGYSFISDRRTYICFYNGSMAYVYDIEKNKIMHIDEQLHDVTSDGTIINTNQGLFELSMGSDIILQLLASKSSPSYNISLAQHYMNFTNNYIYKIIITEDNNSEFILISETSDKTRKTFKLSKNIQGTLIYVYDDILITDTNIYLLDLYQLNNL